MQNERERAKERVEAWWRGELLDRPVVQLTAPAADGVPYDGPDTDDLHAWWTDPAFVIPREVHRLRNTFFGGEAFPVMFPVSGRIVAMLARYLGAPNRYVDKETTWSGHVIDNWATRPTFAFDESNEWWRASRTLLEAGSAAIDESGHEWYLGNPDLNGPTEVLAGLRGREEFAVDFYDEPDAIAPALREINTAWYHAWCAVTAITERHGGYFTFMRVWAERPAVDLQSDVSGLISNEMFVEHLLPAIKAQTNMVERTIFHLDGPDALRHLDTLLALPNLDAIQWVQGAGAPPAGEWIDVMKRIRAGGKSLYVYCEPEEVIPIFDQMDPAGVMLVAECASEEEARGILERLG